MDASIDLNKEYNVQILYIDHWCVFLYSLPHYNFIKLYLSVDSLILQRLYANKHILNLNQAIAMRFSQNKA